MAGGLSRALQASARVVVVAGGGVLGCSSRSLSIKWEGASPFKPGRVLVAAAHTAQRLWGRWLFIVAFWRPQHGR
jgi:hypothetical protein